MRSRDSRRGDFGVPEVDLVFGQFSLVPPLDNLRKWPILVTLLNWWKLDTAGTFGAAVCAKMFFDDCALGAYYLADPGIRAEMIFGPPKLIYFLGSFPLVPPLGKSHKMADFGDFA